MGGDVAPCITAHYHRTGERDFYPDGLYPHMAILEIEMEEAKPIQVAQIYDQKESPMNGRVYSRDGIAPTLRTPTGGLSEPKILEPICCAIRGRNICAGTHTEQHLELGGDVANCLTSVQKDSMVVEPVILTNTRTEKAKELRRQGIEIFANRELVPRKDGCSNTITTVTHDNLLQEQCIIGYSRDHKGNVQSYHEKDCANTIHTHTGSGGNTDQYVKQMVIGPMQSNAMRVSLDGVSPRLTEGDGNSDGQKPMIIQNAYSYNKGGLFEYFSPTVTSSAFQNNNFAVTRCRLRQLTPRECFRLMGMDDADIDRIDAYRIKKTLKNGTVKEKLIPKSQKYKMAGNNIVVDVLYHIFYQMFVADPPKSQPKQLTIFD